MSRFLSNPTLYPFIATDTGIWTWVVGEPLIWEVGPPGSGWLITIQPGFTSDLGSIPWWSRIVFNPANPQVARAYLLHDFINSLTRCELPHWVNSYGSQFAASQFYEAMVIDNVGLLNRKIQFIAVILGIAKSEW
jgi:hypothetical protein